MNSLLYRVDDILKLEIKVDNLTVYNTLNAHSYVLSITDFHFHEALFSSDYLIPDGIGIVWAINFLKGKRIKKISGYDLHIHFLDYLNSFGKGKVFYLGSTSSTLDLLITRCKNEYPNLEFGYYSPPFKDEFSNQENSDMINIINDFNPNILFVGMTAPKQEKWVFKNKRFLKANVVCSIGAVFDFYAGTVKRPSKFWINLGLEWFPRFLKEPRRLWRRNLISTPKFILEVLKAKLSQ